MSDRLGTLCVVITFVQLLSLLAFSLALSMALNGVSYMWIVAKISLIIAIGITIVACYVGKIVAERLELTTEKFIKLAMELSEKYAKPFSPDIIKHRFKIIKSEFEELRE